MARKRRRRSQNPIRVWAKRIGSGVATGLKVSPVLVGIPGAVKEQLAGGNGLAQYVKETVGLDIQRGQTQDVNRIIDVWVRNILLFASGAALSYFVKRA